MRMDENGWQWWWWSWWWTWTWLAPLDAASRMFASSLFCDWGRILTPTFSLICYHKVLFTSFNMRSIPSQSHLQHHDATSIQDVFFRNTVGCQFLIFLLMSNLGGKVLSLGAWLLGLWIEELAERGKDSWKPWRHIVATICKSKSCMRRLIIVMIIIVKPTRVVGAHWVFWLWRL